ncbi:5383_t:CDS:10, partial [Dentiscutata heterogama]
MEDYNNDNRQNNPDVGIDMPEQENTQGQVTIREKILDTISGLGFNINNVIGAAIFVNPSRVWRLVQSPGTALMFWLAGGFVSLFCSLIYVELGTRFPSGSGEQKYLDETFKKFPNFGHIFTFVMITIILPGSIIADTYVSAEYLLFAIQRNENEGDQNIYFGQDFGKLRALAVALLLIITLYHIYSNKLAININKALALIKFLALLIISLIGLAKLRESGFKDKWMGIFNNTPIDDEPQRSVLEQIGSYGNAMLKVIFSYNGWNNLNYSTEELNKPDRSMKYSTIFSVIICLILYILTNAAYISAIDHNAINSNDTMIVSFGRTFGEPGKTLIYLIVSISAFGCVGSMVFMGSRVINYAARTEFIPKFSNSLYKWHKKFDTPSNALAVQFLYCSVLIIFFPEGKSLFSFFSSMSAYLAVVFYGASAICLFVLKEDQKEAQYENFKTPLIL